MDSRRQGSFGSSLQSSDASFGYSSPELSASESDDARSLFGYNAERLIKASTMLSKLETATRIYNRIDDEDDAIQVRDACLVAVMSHRLSAYHEELKRRINNNQNLTPNEYFYFALTTDNVNTLDLTILKRIAETYQGSFKQNLDILIAIREWQTAGLMQEKVDAAVRLNKVLVSKEIECFLNLFGVNLAGADLTKANFNFTDLANSNLSHSNMERASISYSCLNNADLSSINCSEFHRNHVSGCSGPIIHGTVAQQAIFDDATFIRASWNNSDFTGSSFRNAYLVHANFTNSIFDKCNFEGCKLLIEAMPPKSFVSFKDANLVHATLHAVDFKKLELAEARLLSDLNLLHKFDEELDKIQHNTLIPAKSVRDSGLELSEQIRVLQNIIAENIIHHLNQTGLDRNKIVELLEDALEHSIFQPDSLLERIANETDHLIYNNLSGFFTQNNPYRYPYKSKAIEILEAEIDRQEDLRVELAG
ncbi:MAG TPA: pentapeptide repeat-containing protein [Gammaproteobacteria bacterium]|nr:pentapeptide repeat-containing protein [Gammaproteobacteria bacterium]